MVEAGGDGPVEEVRFREAEHEAALKVAKLGGEGESFAETQEVVGLIGETDETTGQAADTALQPDGLFALFLQLQIQIDSAFLGVALDLDGFIFFDAFEIVELIEAEDADFPSALVEKLALVEEQFAADDLVAGGGVAAEVDTANVVLLFFIEAHGDVNALGGIVDIETGFGGEVDETVLAVGFAIVFNRFADLRGREDVALVEREDGLEGVDLKGEGFVRVGADDFQRAHFVSLVFFDRDGDVNGFTVAASGEGHAEPVAMCVEIFETGSPTTTLK